MEDIKKQYKSVDNKKVVILKHSLGASIVALMCVAYDKGIDGRLIHTVFKWQQKGCCGAPRAIFTLHYLISIILLYILWWP